MELQIQRFMNQWHLTPMTWNLVLVVAGIVVGLLIRLFLVLLLRWRPKEEHGYSFFRSCLRHLGEPLSFFIPLFLFDQSTDALELPRSYMIPVSKTIDILLIICFSWLLLRVIRVVQDYVYDRFDLTKPDNL